jgi:hypothetical protein
MQDVMEMKDKVTQQAKEQFAAANAVYLDLKQKLADTEVRPTSLITALYNPVACHGGHRNACAESTL